MARTVLFIVGSCLVVLSTIYDAQQPIQAARFMWTLRVADGRVVLLMAPFALAALASAVSLFFAWKLFRTRRTTAMVAVLVAGAFLPPLAARVGHAAICSFACQRPWPRSVTHPLATLGSSASGWNAWNAFGLGGTSHTKPYPEVRGSCRALKDTRRFLRARLG